MQQKKNTQHIKKTKYIFSFEHNLKMSIDIIGINLFEEIQSHQETDRGLALYTVYVGGAGFKVFFDFLYYKEVSWFILLLLPAAIIQRWT